MPRILAYLMIQLAVLGGLAPLAQAQDLTAKAFYGRFQGSGIAENRDSLYFGVTIRDFDVLIGAEDPGFFVEWTSVIRGGGDPANPDVRRKVTRVTFDPAAEPGVFQARQQGDPLMGEAYGWARIKGQTLSVHLMAIRKDGGYEIQSYDRTLTGNGMELHFVRLSDGEPVREVNGRLIKIAN